MNGFRNTGLTKTQLSHRLKRKMGCKFGTTIFCVHAILHQGTVGSEYFSGFKLIQVGSTCASVVYRLPLSSLDTTINQGN